MFKKIVYIVAITIGVYLGFRNTGQDKSQLQVNDQNQSKNKNQKTDQTSGPDQIKDGVSESNPDVVGHELVNNPTELTKIIETGDENKAIEHIEQNTINYSELDYLGRPPFVAAVESNLTELALKMLEMGADINAKTKDGRSALLVATETDNTELLQILLDKGADPNLKVGNGLSYLMVASINGKEKSIDVLIKNGANINQTNNQGRTALMMAVIEENVMATKKLLEHSADETIRDKEGKTWLDHCQASSNNILLYLCNER